MEENKGVPTKVLIRLFSGFLIFPDALVHFMQWKYPMDKTMNHEFCTYLLVSAMLLIFITMFDKEKP